MSLSISRPIQTFLRPSIPGIVASRSYSSFSSLTTPALRCNGPDFRRRRQRGQLQNVAISISVRYYNSNNLKPKSLPPDQQASYDRIGPIIDNFEAQIAWAVAYGSGVMKQAQAKPGDPPSLTDLLLSTSSPVDFHTVNLRQNPSHYPLHARLMGAGGIAHVQENWGAGVWYVTDVKINNTSVKYGIISTSSLITDLKEWKTFYLSGRLHKPTLSLINPSPSPSSAAGISELQEALVINLKSAISTALLLCPEQFEEDYLWEKIAGLSYSGDPRMSIPGGENPEKVRNIVRGPGAREGFREMYGSYFHEKGVRWFTQKKSESGGEDKWEGEGEGLLCQPTTPKHQAELFDSLPLNLRQAVSKHFTVQSLDTVNEKEIWTKHVQDPKFRSILSTELRNIIHKPALRQSIKGLFTAGFTKSFWYALAKIRKWFKGRSGK